MGEKSFGIDVKIARAVADEIKQVTNSACRSQWSSAAAIFSRRLCQRRQHERSSAITSACWRP
jgi:hypothetical protein